VTEGRLAPAIAVGIWWNANTISHLFIHRPFFRRRAANLWFAAALTALLGFPQSLWRDRHLAHHAGSPLRLRVSGELTLQALVVLSLWTTIAVFTPAFFLSAYVPGYLAGLLLCALHGHYEHAGGTTSHYGRLYNLLCFNDGYHVEHHLQPGLHWTRLPDHQMPAARVSRWPAPLRWLDAINLETLERIVLRSPRLQRLVLRCHARALRELVALLPPIREVAIVGGGLFPRTALILRKVAPDAHLTIVDANRSNLERAMPFLPGDDVTFVHARYAMTPDTTFDAKPAELVERDISACSASSALIVRQRLAWASYGLMVFPLSFDGERSEIYERPPAPAVILHDWIWRRRGTSRVVSVLLLKRMNLVRLNATHE